MKTLITVVISMLFTSSLWAQRVPNKELMVQQFSRVERPSEELIKDIEENDKEVVAVALEKRGSEMVVQTQDMPLTVENSEQFSKYAQRIPYQYELELSEGAEAGVRVEAQQLTAVKRWEDAQFATKGSYQALDQAYQQLDQKGLEILKPEATEEDVEAFNVQIKETREQLALAYRSISDDDLETQHELIETFTELERTGKALYGLNRDDRYPPEAYQRIYQNSRGALALLAEGKEVHCSGVLIADEFVLTNQHCIAGFFPTELRVRFDYETKMDGSTLPTRTLPVTGVVPLSSAQRNGYDFAVLKVGTDGPDGNHAGDLYPVQCISLARVHRNDPLYLIGHPLGEPRTVHDNTFVFFPFLVTELEFAELEMAVRSEFLGATDELDRLQEFRDSYQHGSMGGLPMFQNFSKRWHQQPTIGVDSDTFHGNSGSPTFSRKSHKVVGILFDGEDDFDNPWNVGWRAHEAVLPINMVVERLDDALPDWRNWEGVCIDG